MSIEPISVSQQSKIAKNVIAACKDISKLNKTGYNFVYLCPGFIAHYNLHGFIDYYSENSLAEDILRNRSINMWGNFAPHEQNYEYYMSKKAVYMQILEAL
jgi:hypothetical protein